MAHSGGRFRWWWRALTGSEDTLDNKHLMRMAGRFTGACLRKANAIPVIDCPVGERKHDIAEEHLDLEARPRSAKDCS
jgi:CRISPR/Cas system CMR-associated protein Cmr1 (group 7 of RAMP superfamily)